MEAAGPLLPIQHTAGNAEDSPGPASTELEVASAGADASQTAPAPPPEAAAQPVSEKEAAHVHPDAPAELSPNSDDKASVTAPAQQETGSRATGTRLQAQLLLPFPPPESVLQYLGEAEASLH